MESIAKTMDKVQVPYRSLNYEQLRTEFPMVAPPAGSMGIVEKEGGVLYADKTVQAFQVHISCY